LKNELIEALSKADIVLIDAIFPSAREKEGSMPITALDLEGLAKEKGYTNIKGFDNRNDLIDYAKSIIEQGDVVLTLGAGDIYKIITNLQLSIFNDSLNSTVDPEKRKLVIHHNYPIGDRFTWRVNVVAKYFVEISNEEDLRALVTSKEFIESSKQYILGRGANTLFASSVYNGFVIEINTKGIQKVREDDRYEYWRAMAGEDWIFLVEKIVKQYNLGGLENLAYIPGKVGAAPIQNIAAYGQAFEDACETVEIIDLKTLKHKKYSHDECDFGYRNSIFKKMLAETKHGFVVWAVTLKLVKPMKHTLETGYFSNYESLASELTHLNGKKPALQDIFNAVVSLRMKKLPEISEVGTNGSLFVNPIVSGLKLKELKLKFPRLQYYPADKMKYTSNTELGIRNSELYKIAAGHIFDEIGWKGRRVGEVGTWKNHALVLCNYGTREPGDIIQVIQMMQDDFEKATGIRLEPEISIVQ
jgi:UDP-N-acetylmuramate dehydrogenase